MLKLYKEKSVSPFILWSMLLCALSHLAFSEEEGTFEKFQRHFYYPTGQLQMVQTLVQDPEGRYIVHGPEMQFYPVGTVKSQGVMIQGERSGEWVSVEENGLVTKGSFQQGKRSGNWKVWSQNKKLLVDENYFADKLHGPRKTFYESGQQASERFYNNGLQVGRSTSWYPSGQTMARSDWIEGVKHGEELTWDESGQVLFEGHFKMGVPTDIWKWYDLDGKKINEATFKNGSGVIFDYALVSDVSEKEEEKAQRKLVLRSSTPIRYGKKHGVQKTYYSDGKKQSEVTFQEGIRQGPLKEWYNDGALFREGSFDEDQLSGELKEYRMSDEQKHYLAKETIFDGDFVHAKMVEYDPKGRKLSDVQLAYGKPQGVQRSYFPETGAIAQTGSFENGLKNGLWKEFYVSGATKREQHFLGGKKQGAVQEWYDASEGNSSAQKKLTGTYANDSRVEQWISWYENGLKEKEVNYIDGLEQGTYREYWDTADEEGKEKLKIEGTFVLGAKSGEWKVWHSNGLLQSLAHFESGVKEGVAEEWHDYLIDGRPVPRLHGEFRNGQQHGEWVMFFRNGNPELKQTFRNGKVEGEVEQYYETGVLKSISHFVRGELEGEHLAYHPNEEKKLETTYVRGRLHGEYNEFDEKGERIVSGFYDHGLPTQKWEWFSSSGDVLATSTFSHGSGKYYHFYPSGKKKAESVYVSGMVQGEQKTWYASGQLRSISSFDKGLLHGAHEEFHENGKLLERSNWAYGRRNGTYHSWYGNENKKAEFVFINDQPQGESTEWYDNGKLKVKGMWRDGMKDGSWVWYDRYGDQVLDETYDLGIVVQSTKEGEEGLS